MENIISELRAAALKEKIKKPNFKTKIGREFLAFYLQTKFKQILLFDKKAEKHLFLEAKNGFLNTFFERLIEEPEKRIMIGITGESACGKTTICNKIRDLIDKFNLPVTLLSTDNYFNDISALIIKYGSFDALRDNGYDVDAPTSFQLDLLEKDLLKLAYGEDIRAPQYLVNGTGISIPLAIPVKSSKIIVVEGLCSLYESISDIFDLKIYVEIDEKIRKKRFLKRASDRNQDKENALKHWEYLNNSGDKYIKVLKDKCDIVVSGECDLDYFRDIIEYLKLITNNFHDSIDD